MEKIVEYSGVIKSMGEPTIYQLFFKLTGKYSFNVIIENELAVGIGLVLPNTYKIGWTKIKGTRRPKLPEIVSQLIFMQIKDRGYSPLYITGKISTNEQIVYSSYFNKIINDRIRTI